MATSNPQNNYVSLVTPDTTVKREAGWCLSHTQAVFKAPVMYPSATAAANATTQRVASRNMPNVAVPVWFDHWGTYQGRYDNWGHVVAWIPGHGFLSSPTSGYGQQWYPSIEAVERAFNAKFRFWSLDINTKIVAKPAPPANPIGKKPVYKTNWIKDGHKQVIPANGTYRYVQMNKKGDITIVFGPSMVTGNVSVGITGTPGTKVTLRAVKDVTNSTGTKVSKQNFVEEVDGVIPADGNLIINLAITNQIPRGERMRVMLKAKGKAGEKVTMFRYAQKFMEWK